MADIFVSYAKTDRSLASKLVAVLEAEGWSVWWDTSLAVGDDFRNEIMTELGRARAVIVIWTDASIKSDWVRSEGGRAQADRKLIPVKLAHLNYKDLPGQHGQRRFRTIARLSGRKESPALAGLSVRRNVERENRTFLVAPVSKIHDLGGLGTAPAASTGSTMVVEKGPKKKPRQKKGGTSIWVRGGRLAFSLHKAIPPSFTLHKAKVPCPPRARKWPRCRRGQFLPDTQIYWSAEGAAFSFRYQNQFGAWGIVPPAFITRIRQLCACRGPFPAHIFAAGDPTAWLA